MKTLNKTQKSNNNTFDVKVTVAADTSNLKIHYKKDKNRTPFYRIPVNVLKEDGTYFTTADGRKIVFPADMNMYKYERDENGFNIKDVDETTLEENPIPEKGDMLRAILNRFVDPETGKILYFCQIKNGKFPSPESVLRYLEDMLS